MDYVQNEVGKEEKGKLPFIFIFCLSRSALWSKL